MEQYIQIAVGVASLMLLGLGTMSMFAPAKMTKNFSIEPMGAAGLSTIRSVIGGLFLASLALMVAGLVTGDTQWFLAVAALMIAVAVGRIVGIAADGFDGAVVPPLVVEIVIAAVLITAHLQLSAI